MSTSPLTVVQQWHHALNNAQMDEMLELVHPQVEIGGARGSERGVQTVREWFGRANVRLVPYRWFVQGNQVVVEQAGEWFSPVAGQLTNSQMVATAFCVNDDGLITRIVRHDALEAALEDICATIEDEVEE